MEDFVHFMKGHVRFCSLCEKPGKL